MTILIVEQYLDFVREFSQHFYIMNRGRIVEGGETQDLTDELVKNYLSVLVCQATEAVAEDSRVTTFSMWRVWGKRSKGCTLRI